jgi:cytochrome o ubiquinol oxidase subunit 2
MKKYKFYVIGIIVIAVISIAAWYLNGVSIPVLEPKGPIAQKEFNLIVFASLLSLVVVIPVFTITIMIAWKYREGNEKAKYSPEFDHSRIIETIWWLIPSALILILSVVAWNSSHDLDPFKPLASKVPPITVQVVALDWKWLFIYPKQGIATVNYLEFPRNTPVSFDITSDTVMNSFWLPQLGGQIYAMPGMATELHLMASQYGSFDGSSANISGTGFSGMTFVAKSVSSSEFNSWVSSVKRSKLDLNQNSYNELTKPSEYNSDASYTLSDQNLFNNIIYKYMTSGGTSTNNYGSSSASSNMSGMDMQ